MQAGATLRFGTAESQDESPCRAIHRVKGWTWEFFRVLLRVASWLERPASKPASSPAAYLRQAGDSAEFENSKAFAWVICKDGPPDRVECPFAEE